MKMWKYVSAQNFWVFLKVGHLVGSRDDKEVNSWGSIAGSSHLLMQTTIFDLDTWTLKVRISFTVKKGKEAAAHTSYTLNPKP